MTPGDIVQIKSGGPRMTVVAIFHDEPRQRDMVDVVYITAGGEYRHVSLDSRALQLLDGPFSLEEYVMSVSGGSRPYQKSVPLVVDEL